MVLIIGGLISAGLIAAAVSNSNPSVQFAVIISVASGIISGVVLQPFSASVVTVLYYDLRIRKEGYDLELLADQLGLEASGLPPHPDAGSGTPAGWADGPSGGFRGPVGPDDVGKPGGPPYWPPPPGWRPTD